MRIVSFIMVGSFSDEIIDLTGLSFLQIEPGKQQIVFADIRSGHDRLFQKCFCFGFSPYVVKCLRKSDDMNGKDSKVFLIFGQARDIGRSVFQLQIGVGDPVQVQHLFIAEIL